METYRGGCRMEDFLNKNIVFYIVVSCISLRCGRWYCGAGCRLFKGLVPLWGRQVGLLTVFWDACHRLHHQTHAHVLKMIQFTSFAPLMRAIVNLDGCQEW